MKQSSVAILCAICLIQISSAVAEDYLVHLERVGYKDIPDSVLGPRETVLNSLQLVTPLGKPFRGRCVIGRNVIAVSGELQRSDDGHLHLSLQYESESEESGFITIDGVKLPNRSTQGVKTEITIQEGKTVLLGGGVSHTSQPVEGTNHATKSKQMATIRATRLDPSKPTPEEKEAADQQQLQSVWTGVEVTEDGEPLADTLARQIQLRVIQDRMVWKGPARFERQSYDFELDASTTPHRIKLWSLDGADKGKSANAIYDLSSGDLVIAIPEFKTQGNDIPGLLTDDAPTKFESTAGSKLKLIRLRRN